MGAKIVFRDDLDVLVSGASMQLVLDAEVGEVDRLIEVRQVMFARPLFDFAGVPIRSPVAVRPAAIRLLQPLLVLALELLLEHDAMDLRALFAQAFLFAQIGTIKLDIVRQFTGAADAVVEGLLASIVAVRRWASGR